MMSKHIPIKMKNMSCHFDENWSFFDKRIEEDKLRYRKSAKMLQIAEK